MYEQRNDKGKHGCQKKYERFRYTQKDLDTALRAIISGSMTLNKASIQFNVPKSPKEPVPFGLTGLKCKEYFARQDAEKQKKEEDLKQKQKKRSDNAELRKRKLEIKKETQLKKDQVPSGQPKPKKLRKKETHQPTTTFNEDIVTGKYLIVSFKTEKRIRYFVGQVLETNKLQKKIKIDFLRKKSVSENIVNFVRPQVPDVSEVDFADVHRVLSDPNISRRGFMSFQDVSFKDIE